MLYKKIRCLIRCLFFSIVCTSFEEPLKVLINSCVCVWLFFCFFLVVVYCHRFRFKNADFFFPFPVDAEVPVLKDVKHYLSFICPPPSRPRGPGNRCAPFSHTRHNRWWPLRHSALFSLGATALLWCCWPNGVRSFAHRSQQTQLCSASIQQWKLRFIRQSAPSFSWKSNLLWKA